jgi:hypothetical protein
MVTKEDVSFKLSRNWEGMSPSIALPSNLISDKKGDFSNDGNGLSIFLFSVYDCALKMFAS